MGKNCSSNLKHGEVENKNYCWYVEYREKAQMSSIVEQNSRKLVSKIKNNSNQPSVLM